MTNAARHARADTIVVSLLHVDEAITVRVVDDGVGFDAGASQVGRGVRGMRSRADDLGGAFRLDSSIGRGTSIELIVPIRQLMI